MPACAAMAALTARASWSSRRVGSFDRGHCASTRGGSCAALRRQHAATGRFWRCRTQPSLTSGARIMVMPNGTALRILERRADGWWRVRAEPSGQEGWALAYRGNRNWIECCLTAAVAQPAAAEVPLRWKGSNRRRTTSTASPSRSRMKKGLPAGRSAATFKISPIVCRRGPRDCDLDWGAGVRARHVGKAGGADLSWRYGHGQQAAARCLTGRRGSATDFVQVGAKRRDLSRIRQVTALRCREARCGCFDLRRSRSAPSVETRPAGAPQNEGGDILGG